eukprot:NODE_1965_length_406_cov_82.860215_g1955_i0.p1 GENE.NODE_1965_length_406_cov_82.860215_g1955_i0~~NODE_1965_length_406_cov_82.860215_g1955_i0.p1  ORF type:complete len:54 (+),score=10.80 NODE_1965_length_406_cov_82.860215_g1955_i0:241-402(+)
MQFSRLVSYVGDVAGASGIGTTVASPQEGETGNSFSASTLFILCVKVSPCTLR